MEDHDKDFVILSLQESNDILSSEVSRLRNSMKILRTVNRSLREANESLKRQVAIAITNDDMFKSYCQGEFDAVTDPEGGLPDGF